MSTQRMIDKLLLPFHFDVKKMQDELAQFTADDWIPHFNKEVYNGDWSAIPFRSVNGDPRNITPDHTGKFQYRDTPHLERSPYFKEIVSSFECDKVDVRLLRLSAGSHINEHRDFGLAYENGEVRIHIPVVTSPILEFYFNRERMHLQEGECWYLNFNLPHEVKNLSTIDRIHLVMDCKVNAWTDKLFGYER